MCVYTYSIVRQRARTHPHKYNHIFSTPGENFVRIVVVRFGRRAKSARPFTCIRPRAFTLFSRWRKVCDNIIIVEKFCARVPIPSDFRRSLIEWFQSGTRPVNLVRTRPAARLVSYKTSNRYMMIVQDEKYMYRPAFSD